MDLIRECYIITYKYQKVFNKIKKIKGLDIFYSSKKSRYVTAYFDVDDKKRIMEELKKIKGVQKIEPSRLDRAEINIKL